MQEMAALWVRHQPRVAGFIAAAVPDFHAAEDLLQEVAVDVAKKFATFDRSRPFAPWVLGIARNSIASYYRRGGGSKLVFSDELLRQMATAIEQAEPELIEDRKEALHHCIRSLKGDSRQIIEQRYLLSNSMAEIANHLKITASAASVRLHRARKLLADCIDRRLAIVREQ